MRTSRSRICSLGRSPLRRDRGPAARPGDRLRDGLRRRRTHRPAADGMGRDAAHRTPISNGVICRASTPSSPACGRGTRATRSSASGARVSRPTCSRGHAARAVQHRRAGSRRKDGLQPLHHRPRPRDRGRGAGAIRSRRIRCSRRPIRSRPPTSTGGCRSAGLYFATAWDSTIYRAPLACNDPGEPPRSGGLIYTTLGDGLFIYTGYAFFRQLPACVPGAYRLFANLVSAEKAKVRNVDPGIPSHLKPSKKPAASGR